MDPISEMDIIRACQNGDLKRFAGLYDAYVERIHAFIYHRTLHRETAEDLTSQVFLKVLERMDTFDAEKGTFSSWIYRIARNAIIDHYRTRKNETDVDGVPGLSARIDIERDADVRRGLLGVEEALQALEPHQREILILRLWDGCSHKEIAEIVGGTEASVKMAFSRAVRILRNRLGAGALLSMLIIAKFLWPH